MKACYGGLETGDGDDNETGSAKVVCANNTFKCNILLTKFILL